MPDLVIFVIVALAGGVGAVARCLVDRFASGRSDFQPWATPLVNIVGSTAFGCLLGSTGVGLPFLIVGTGFLGGFTTFSTASLEALRQLQESRYVTVIALTVGQSLLSLAGCAAGYAILAV